jgi:ribonuclease Z
MSIEWNILGKPGADNAALVTIDSGQSIHHLLFDCGEGCLSGQRNATIQSIEHLCFSHFHMDHVSGFDTFFRHNYNRPEAPVNVWGPEQTIAVMHHRFRSFTWNLHREQAGEWHVREIGESTISGARFQTKEAFANAHPMSDSPISNRTVFTGPSYRIEAFLLPHHTATSAAYRIIEADRRNICPGALQKSGLRPGPWLQELTGPEVNAGTMLEVEGRQLDLQRLQSELLVSTPGKSIAYLTDFRIEPGSQQWENVREWLSGTDTLIAECQYQSQDEALAVRNGHMTANRIGQLAAESSVQELVLIHLSRRYTSDEWRAMREEAKREFPAAKFPPEWAL